MVTYLQIPTGAAGFFRTLQGAMDVERGFASIPSPSSTNSTPSASPRASSNNNANNKSAGKLSKKNSKQKNDTSSETSSAASSPTAAATPKSPKSPKSPRAGEDSETKNAIGHQISSSTTFEGHTEDRREWQAFIDVVHQALRALTPIENPEETEAKTTD